MKRKDEKENYKKIDIRKKQEDLESTVRILFLSGLTVDYSIGIDRINTEWVLNQILTIKIRMSFFF